METITNNEGIRGSVESLIGGRYENQDSYGIAETPLGLMVAVCDGMGGGPAGKTASSLAVQAIIDYVTGANAGSSPLSVLTDAILAANDNILAAVAANPTLKGMGTTCVVLLIGREEAYIAHVGDSRCYQLRDGKVIFRTADHSYVGELVRRGTLTEEEARNSQYSNVITRAIGVDTGLDPEVESVPYRPGDRFALMTDGIWGTLPETQMVRFLSERTHPDTIVAELTKNVDTLGRDNGGGHDNLTLAVVDIPAKKHVEPPVTYKQSVPVENESKLTKEAAVNDTRTAKAKPDVNINDTEKNKSFVLRMTIVIVTAIVICFIAFLFFNSGNKGVTPDPYEQETGRNVPVVEVQPEHPKKKPVKDKENKDNNGKKPTEVKKENNKEQTTDPKVVEKILPQKEEDESQRIKNKNIEADIPEVALAKFNEAIAMLDSLNKKYPTSKYKTDNDVKKLRNTDYTQLKSCLQQGYKALPEGGELRAKAESLYKSIESKRVRKILVERFYENKKDGLFEQRQQELDSIRAYQKRIREIIRQ